MKVRKIYEDIDDEISLQEKIMEILDYELETQQVRYTDDIEISTESKSKAALKIIEYLKQRGLLLALDAEKYNL